ncbi:TIGR02281 family clan AA aspartic protease [Pontixanthobacter aestiaquae]|uniref:TIGR02281 family clan AA aspartic protease n=1 Tax=Pontixanthobacter aestiaquae TaxID=1509367 RepID=A0A844Z9M6_9SPHN|nr:TIGR02281 family clan AA aspartic protease [Pontixanthobacter aestiaquae]MDN3644977.1 TIGR02281 family clan AA aspartic protease [Pontixanthobacter aestiaquae]MXO84022.1 TIGR02281 family clan AA aspartic protease [Pontixanthobacter aestiaquae]
MDSPGVLADIWSSAAAVLSEVPRSGLLMATLAALIAGWIGAIMVRRDLPLGGLVRVTSTLALTGIVVAIVLQMVRFDPRIDLALPTMGLPEQVVEGGETRIPLAPDGHYWLVAQVNGEPVRFMVDTGATLTAVSSKVADRVGMKPRAGGLPVQLSTANGTASAYVATMDELRFGNVAARGLDVIIAPNLGDTSVIGMNLLSRLKGWRVEDGVMILTPNNPQPPLEILAE